MRRCHWSWRHKPAGPIAGRGDSRVVELIGRDVTADEGAANSTGRTNSSWAVIGWTVSEVRQHRQ